MPKGISITAYSPTVWDQLPSTVFLCGVVYLSPLYDSQPKNCHFGGEYDSSYESNIMPRFYYIIIQSSKVLSRL